MNQLKSPNKPHSRSPLFSAGSLAPVENHFHSQLDLNQYLIRNPASTFFVRVTGDSMCHAGIYDNDILIVDRSLKAADNDIVVANLNGELTTKRLCLKGSTIYLKSENASYSLLKIQEEMDFIIWGVVTSAIHQFRAYKE